MSAASRAWWMSSVLIFLDRLFTPRSVRLTTEERERLDFLRWESEIARPYDWQADGL